MSLTRRGLLATGTATAATSTILPRRARAQKPVIKIGVINDQSGPYRDLNGPTSVVCTKLAVQEFAAQGFDVQVIDADHQNKADIASSIARQWIDQQGVDMIMDCAGSSAALALNSLCREKDKVLLPTSTATSDLTGAQCSPNTIHWVYDTYMLAKVVGSALAKAGGDSWYFITPNYAFGHAMQRDASVFIAAAGGKVLGSNIYPFPETTDFSAPLLQAKASGAKVIGLASAGADTVNCIKQAREFGIAQSGVKMASLLFTSTDVRAVGLEAAQGLQMTESYYWDLNDRTRRFNDKAKTQMKLWPNSFQAGNYSATLHYLKAVTAMGVAEAKKSGRAVIERMKAIPTDDDAFGVGKIREDGRKIHPAYLFEVKKPSESKHEWDLLKLVATTPAEETFRPLSETACPLVKKS